MDPTQDVMDNETKISVSKKMFIGGFFGLPWLWLVNFLLFYRYFHRRSCPDEVKFYAKTSLVLSLIGFVLVIGWFLYFSLFKIDDWPNLIVRLPQI